VRFSVPSSKRTLLLITGTSSNKPLITGFTTEPLILDWKHQLLFKISPRLVTEFSIVSVLIFCSKIDLFSVLAFLSNDFLAVGPCFVLEQSSKPDLRLNSPAYQQTENQHMTRTP
jgi:hypothetical protein